VFNRLLSKSHLISLGGESEELMCNSSPSRTENHIELNFDKVLVWPHSPIV